MQNLNSVLRFKSGHMRGICPLFQCRLALARG